MALPFDDRLFKIMQRCLSPEKSDRFKSGGETMEAILALVDLDPGLGMRGKIPTKPGIETDEGMRLEMLTNIGNGLLNHGYFSSAQRNLEECLLSQGELPQVPTVKGVTSARSLMQVDSTSEGCSDLCDLGVDEVVKRFMEAAATDTGRSSIECMRSLAALAALTIGNNDNAVAIASRGMTLFNTLSLICKECLSKKGEEGSLMALLTVCQMYFLSSAGKAVKLHIIESGVLDLLPDLIRMYGSNACLVMQTSWFKRNMIISVAEDVKWKVCTAGTVDALIDSVRTYHMEDPLASSLVINNFFNFTVKPSDRYYQYMLEARVPDLVREIGEKHASSSMVAKAYYEKLARRF